VQACFQQGAWRPGNESFGDCLISAGDLAGLPCLHAFIPLILPGNQMFATSRLYLFYLYQVLSNTLLNPIQRKSKIAQVRGYRYRGRNAMSQGPVFIGGMERSGTSLMRSMIGSHPAVAIFQWDLPVWTKIYPDFQQEAIAGEQLCDAVLDAFFNSQKVQKCELQLDRERIKSRVLSKHEFGFAEIASAFLCEYAELIGRPRWGLKTPLNELYAEQIFSSYGNASMIQMVRDPRDCSLSMQNYDEKWAIRYDALEHVEAWRQSVTLGKKHAQRFGERYLIVRYEDLVVSPKSVMRNVCKTLDLEFHPQMLLMNGHLGWRGNSSSFRQHKPRDEQISTDSIGRYQQSNEFDQRFFQSMLQPELELFGYTIDQKQTTLPHIIRLAIHTEKALRGTPLEKHFRKLRRHFIRRARRSASKAA
jgi:hypothetical protein